MEERCVSLRLSRESARHSFHILSLLSYASFASFTSGTLASLHRRDLQGAIMIEGDALSCPCTALYVRLRKH